MLEQNLIVKRFHFRQLNFDTLELKAYLGSKISYFFQFVGTKSNPAIIAANSLPLGSTPSYNKFTVAALLKIANKYIILNIFFYFSIY